LFRTAFEYRGYLVLAIHLFLYPYQVVLLFEDEKKISKVLHRVPLGTT
jgi:hypothetical protein